MFRQVLVMMSGIENFNEHYNLPSSLPHESISIDTVTKPIRASDKVRMIEWGSGWVGENEWDSKLVSEKVSENEGVSEWVSKWVSE